MDIWIDIPTPIEAVLPRRVVLSLAHPLIIGTSPHAGLILSGESVGWNHCEVGRDGCGPWVRDLNSLDGTFINGHQIGGDPRSLLPTDRLNVGKRKLRVGWDFVVNPLWLSWEAGIVVSLAKQVRDEGDEDAMPILADALEEAGCTESEILHHMRGPGPHVRECWVIHALLTPIRRKSKS